MLVTQPKNILAHIIGWILFICLIGGFAISVSETKNFFELFTAPPFIFFILIYVTIFYFNAYYLFPALYLTKKYVAYFVVMIAVSVLAYFLEPFDNLLGHGSRRNGPPQQGERFRDRGSPPPERPNNNDRPFTEQPPPPSGPPDKNRGPSIDIVSIVLLVVVFSVSSVIPIIKQWRKTEQRVLQAETDKANAELSFLRAQINPHFLFNTLNNIYTLVVTKSEGGPQAILKLSNMLRYITDEATQDFVPLEKEIACISNYIALQQLRLNKNMVIHFTVNGLLEHHKLPPLILMTFVENVFKYGISSHENTDITIVVTAADNSVRFYCRNKIFALLLPSERNGIGIDNARKRLQFLYPGKHHLEIENEDGLFTVNLDINTATV